MTAPVRFTVWSDFLCPWCYVAAARLEAVRREAGDALRIEWKSFLLRAVPEERPMHRFRAYTESWLRPARAEPATRFAIWSGDNPPPTHSMPSAIAGKVAASFGEDAFDRFHLALMHAYFAESRDISDRAEILDVAAGCGLDAETFAARLDGRSAELAAAVLADHKDALGRGIAAVPTVVVDGEHILSGALQTAQYLKILTRLAS